MKLILISVVFLFATIPSYASGVNAKYNHNNIKLNKKTTHRNVANLDEAIDEGVLNRPRPSRSVAAYKVRKYSIDGQTCVVSFISTQDSGSDTEIHCFKP